MTSKKNKQKNQKITNFFKPIVSSKSATTLSNPVHSTLAPQMRPKVLADSTNIPPKKKKLKSIHNPVNPVVIEINSSPVRLDLHSDNLASSPLKSSEIENEFFPKNKSTSAMLGSNIALDNDENELFVIGENRKRKFKNDSHDSETASVIEVEDELPLDRPILPVRGMRCFTDQVVTLSQSGELRIDGEIKGQWDFETMTLIKTLKLDTSKILVNADGYLHIAGSGIHCVLGRSKLQANFVDFVAEGFTGGIDDLDSVAHLDDDKNNCNVSNLMNMPFAWNQNLKKVKGAKPKGKKWYCQLSIAQSKAYNTVSVSDPDEALVQYDILKVKHCVKHVKESPLIAQRLIFQYGLVRPSKFVKRGYYKDIKTLISHAEDWTKAKRMKVGYKQEARERFPLVSLEDASQPTLESLNIPGNAPFNPDYFVIFAYVGKKKLPDGTILRHERIVNKEFYEEVVLNYEGGVSVNQDGYMMFNDLGMMHNVALGRSRGDYKEDGLQGCHGVGGILDNRVITLDDLTLDPRCLTTGSASVNSSHINHKKEGSKSDYPGVKPSGEKWYGSIRFDGSDHNLGTYSTEIDAANAYAWVQSDRRTIETRLVKVPKDAEKSVKKSLRAANAVIVKSFIKFDGKGKPTLHDNVKLIRDRLLENAGGGP